MNEESTFARRLREAREAIGVSQKQLGIQAGIDQFVASARINQYERGKHMPDMLTAGRLAFQLNVPVSYLFEPDDDLAALLKAGSRLPRTKLRQLVKHLQENEFGSTLK